MVPGSNYCCLDQKSSTLDGLPLYWKSLRSATPHHLAMSPPLRLSPGSVRTSSHSLSILLLTGIGKSATGGQLLSALFKSIISTEVEDSPLTYPPMTIILPLLAVKRSLSSSTLNSQTNLRPAWQVTLAITTRNKREIFAVCMVARSEV